MVVACGPVVVVVVDVDALGDVVVVTPPDGSVVLVVVAVPAVVVVVVADVVDVVDVVDVGVVLGAGDGLTRFFSVVPVSAPPKIVASGLPEISSTAVMNRSASTNTMTALAAVARHENPRDTAVRTTPGGAGIVEACKCSVAGASVAALISSRSVSAAGTVVDAIPMVSSAPDPGCGPPTTSVGAEDASTDDVDGPLVPVPPSLRNNVEVSGTRTATCLTAWWPRSIDCATRAVPMVAAAEPMATPTIVPLTPKVDATMAAMTAPAVEARIWRNENFTTGVSSRPRGVRRRG